MKDELISKFLLVDNCDETFSDLIEFDEPVKLSDVYECINKCTSELEGTYTNEDIYQYLGKLNVGFKIIFLGNYEKIYY